MLNSVPSLNPTFHRLVPSFAIRSGVGLRSLPSPAVRTHRPLWTKSGWTPGLQQSLQRRRTYLHNSVSLTELQTEQMAKEIFRKDYKPTPYLIETVSMSFNLNEDVTTVKTTSHFVDNPANSEDRGELFLNGRSDLKLISVKINSTAVAEENLQQTNDSLTVKSLPPAPFDLEVVTEIKPQENTLLAGLYKSSGNYCTQCEAEGFRGITFYYDRPDVMAKYDVRIEAEKERYPVLLSNGNLTEKGDLPNGRHFTKWADPFPKPCYLFALVAGDLACIEDSFETTSDKKVTLRIYVQHYNKEKVGHAMKSIKQAMEWDQSRFGLEYDLDLFNMVVVDDFNMGAMENNSLNIFNSRYVLASPETATDTDYISIQRVVGHEYFHNWTGDRVTCRDWFQLTLKEGLTVFRDHEFSSDMNSRPVRRIGDVSALRATQFPEDAGPTAHPIRPESYIKMDNFYTDTVYEKGGEIVRIYQTILGVDGFRKGLDLYFERYDGQAVTCDDFLDAMATANSKDLSSLAVWYGQAGTPELTVSTDYNAKAKTFTLKASQSTPPTPGQSKKDPVLLPITVGLLGPDGQDLPLILKGSKNKTPVLEMVLEFDKKKDSFTFVDVPVKPVPSILRSFSAPVKLTVEDQTEEDLVFLFARDNNEFNRWDAGQTFSKKVILKLYEDAKNASGEAEFGPVPENLINAFKAVLEDNEINGRFAALATTLPSQSELINEIPEVDPVLLCRVTEHVVYQLSSALETTLISVLEKNDAAEGEEYAITQVQMSKRALKNRCLSYLASLKKPEYLADCLKRFRGATNMTDAIAAISALNDIDCEERKTALDEFYTKWKDDYLVVNKWLNLQSMSNIENNKSNVEALLQHESYQETNPNCNYSIFLGFADSPVNFHAADGSGYQFEAENLIRLDKINAQVGARISTVFTQWRQFDLNRQELMKKYITQVLETPGLSENSKEILAKALEG